MKDTDRVKLLEPHVGSDAAHWQQIWEGTWKDFVDENIDAGMGREEIEEAAGSLDQGEMHMFGGGASAIFFLGKVAGWNLESVGTYLRADGWCFPMTIGGGYDDDEGTSHHIRDVAPEDDGYEWWQSLSDDDRKTVEEFTARVA